MMEHVHSFSLLGFVYRYNFVFQEKTVVTTKRSTPVSVDLNDKRDGNGGEGSSQLPKQAAASETRASGNSQLNSSAVPKVFKEHCTGNSAVPYGALSEF